MAEQSALQEKIYNIIFGTQSPAGRRFDLFLIIAILLSVTLITLDSIAAVHDRLGDHIRSIEWALTILFTAEYMLRLYCSPNPRAYIFSFYGIVDLLSILPSYLSLLIPGAHQLAVIRILRVLRIFRVLKLARFMTETNTLTRSIFAARRKITVFMFTVLSIIVVVGSVMYAVEGPEHGFTSLPRSIYWAIVTVTTVGYGDITPQTALGQFVAAVAMITSYAIIAIPTGIISAEIINESQRQRVMMRCSLCERAGHDGDASYCKHCGAELPDSETKK